MKIIPLSKTGKNKGKYFATVDDEDFDMLIKNKWCVLKVRTINYAYRMVKDINGKPKAIMMHREIMKIENKNFIDHINRNGLDNTKSNLRECTNSQNQANSKLRTGKTSVYRGVYYDAAKSKFIASIWQGKKRFHIGVFSCEKSAAKAYDNKAKEFFGEFASTNIAYERQD